LRPSDRGVRPGHRLIAAQERSGLCSARKRGLSRFGQSAIVICPSLAEDKALGDERSEVMIGAVRPALADLLKRSCPDALRASIGKIAGAAAKRTKASAKEPLSRRRAPEINGARPDGPGSSC
jgi:hypothetical protein